MGQFSVEILGLTGQISAEINSMGTKSARQLRHCLLAIQRLKRQLCLVLLPSWGLARAQRQIVHFRLPAERQVKRHRSKDL